MPEIVFCYKEIKNNMVEVIPFNERKKKNFESINPKNYDQIPLWIDETSEITKEFWDGITVTFQNKDFFVYNEKELKKLE